MKGNMRTISLFLLVLFISCGLLAGCGSRKKGWHGQGEFSGRAFDFGDHSNVEVQVSKGAHFSEHQGDLAILLADLIKQRIEARGLATTNTVAYVGGENMTDMKIRGRTIHAGFALSAQNTFGMASVLKVNERRPIFYFGPPIPVTISGHYNDPESFYAGAQAEFTPIVDRLLDVVFAQIQKNELTP